jgi:formylglycine-generating enzyme required for sulfatase activity
MFRNLIAVFFLLVSVIAPNAVQEVQSRAMPKQNCPPGMVWIPGGEFEMGGAGKLARPDEFPVHKVKVSGFFMDETEVTNAQFRKFVESTGYVTTAEKKPDWEEIKKQLPPHAKKPQKDFAPGSLVFISTSGPVPLNDISRWWKWIEGADWRHPLGPGSSIDGKDDHPVVQVSWDDASAYCKWANKRLPTEAEWEYAARAGKANQEYSWGKQMPEGKRIPANLWQGGFPYDNKCLDKYSLTAPVRSFAPNAYGLYDMIGNVWEWCSDWYRSDYYSGLASSSITNPEGPQSSYDPGEPNIAKRVKRGGSFLCCEQYCSSYRPSARMKASPDSSQNHLGFRAVKSEFAAGSD